MSDIPADQLKIEAWPIPGRVTHIPSGVAAFVGTDRSQHINKMIATDMILAAITHPKFR